MTDPCEAAPRPLKSWFSVSENPELLLHAHLFPLRHVLKLVPAHVELAVELVVVQHVLHRARLQEERSCRQSWLVSTVLLPD